VPWQACGLAAKRKGPSGPQSAWLSSQIAGGLQDEVKVCGRGGDQEHRN
jgi:hypothetical protein